MPFITQDHLGLAVGEQGQEKVCTPHRYPLTAPKTWHREPVSVGEEVILRQGF